MEDGDGPKIKQAKTRNIFCLFVFVVVVLYLASDRQSVSMLRLSLLVFQSGVPVVYQRENPGEEFSTRVTSESHASS